MDFTLPHEVDETRRAIRAFVADRILPLEQDRANFDDHENIRMDLLKEIQAEARAAGLWSLSMPTERGWTWF